MTDWEPFEIEDIDKSLYIPIARWGLDHWSTLAYLETRAVDDHGIIDNRKMRCNPRLHRPFAHSADGTNCPTRLRNGEIANHHDDWSCLEDMVAAGILIAYFRVAKHGEVFGGSQGRIELTDEGRKIANDLRTHRGAGGRYADFQPTVSEAQ